MAVLRFNSAASQYTLPSIKRLLYKRVVDLVDPSDFPVVDIGLLHTFLFLLVDFDIIVETSIKETRFVSSLPTSSFDKVELGFKIAKGNK